MSGLPALREAPAEPSPPLHRVTTRIGEVPPTASVRIGRNFIYRISSQAVSAVINVAAMILLGRALGPEGYGEYAFFYALIPLISNLATAGIGIIVTREIARDPDDAPRLLGDAILLRVALGVVVAIAVVALAPAWFGPAETLLVFIVTAAALLDFGQDVSIWLLRAHERLDLEARLLLVSQVVWIALIAGAVVLDAGLPILLGAATVAFALRAVVGIAIVRRRYPAPLFRPDGARLRAMLREGLPFGLALFGVVLYGRVGLLLLKGMSTTLDVSYFQVGYLLSQPFTFVATALSMAMFPTLARHAQDQDRDLKTSLRRAFKWQFLLALPLTLGLVVLADPLIKLFFHGHGFDKAAAALRLMSLGLTLIFLNHAARYVLAAVDRQRHYLIAVLVGLVVNALTCVALIPRFGFIGACLGLLAAEAAIWIVCQQALARRIHPAEIAIDAFRPICAAAVAALWMFALPAMHPVVVGVAAAFTYVLILWWTHALSPGEIRILRGIASSFVGPGRISAEPGGGMGASR